MRAILRAASASPNQMPGVEIDSIAVATLLRSMSSIALATVQFCCAGHSAARPALSLQASAARDRAAERNDDAYR